MSLRLEQIVAFLREGEGVLRSLADRHDTSIGFNAFELVSDVYRRENFHSDILRAILDPRSKHGEGMLFLRLFVDFLIKVANFRGASFKGNEGLASIKSSLQVDSDVRVVREEGHIDILVECADWAIIIENKINGAVDTDRQLPNYVEKTRKRLKKVAAVVYITAATEKEPNLNSWEKGDKEMVLPLLLPTIGYNETPSSPNLVVGWLEPCELHAKSFATKAVLSQYCELLRNQSGETMNQPEMMKLFSILKTNKIGYAELLHAIQGMPHALAVMIVEKFKERPGLRMAPWIWRDPSKDACAVFDFEKIKIPAFKGVQFAVDICCDDLSNWGIQFFVREGSSKVDLRNCEPILQKFDPKFKYYDNHGRIIMYLNENQVFQDVEGFIALIERLLDYLQDNMQKMVELVCGA